MHGIETIRWVRCQPWFTGRLAMLGDVTAPILMITGWYDIFLPSQLRTYAQLVAVGRMKGQAGSVSSSRRPALHADQSRW